MWKLGDATGSSSVQWEDFSCEEDARRAWERRFYGSKVLFDAEGLPADFYCTDPVDVGMIMEAQRTGTTPDREEVARGLEAGDVPLVAPDRASLKQWLLKAVMRATFFRRSVELFGAAPLRRRSLCFFDRGTCPAVEGHVGLTIDDAPCRFGPRCSRVAEVKALLADHGARATFMLVGKFVRAHEQDLVGLLEAGHEFGNHGMLDRPYDKDSAEEFGRSVDECNDLIRGLHREAGVDEEVRWFRSPHGRYTAEMEAELRRRGLTNVMCDTYASDPVVQDGHFVGQFLAQRADAGSIILIHMPERGFRTWCMEGLRLLLTGLQERGLKAVTVGELARLAGFVADGPPSQETTSEGSRSLDSTPHGR